MGRSIMATVGTISLTVALWVGVQTAQAMQFAVLPLEDSGKVVIAATGEIIPGDLDRLAATIERLPPTLRIVGYSLDSPGGNLLEAEKIANGIHRMQTTVGVLGQARCVSACFLLFAAGATKLTDPTALIGVHSASEAGGENTESLALTTAMARDVAELGVPPGIIGKMVTATPGQVEWLTQRDLASMGVKILRDDAAPPPASVPPVASAPNRLPAAAVAALPAGLMAPAPIAAQDPVTFRQGFADRQSWEQWFASISGPYLDGAAFWAQHRSDHKIPSCYGDAGMDPGSFTAGCLAAQQRLSATDVRRQSDPDYRRGWNSL